MIYGHGKVGRNVSISHCYGQRLNKDNNEFEDFNFDVIGCYVEDRATLFARRLFSDKSIIITNVEIETHFYTMDLEVFIQHAERTN